MSALLWIWRLSCYEQMAWHLCASGVDLGVELIGLSLHAVLFLPSDVKFRMQIS